MWLILIILFVAFYQIFSVPRDPNAVAEPVPTTQWWSIFSQWLPIIFLFVFFVFFMRALQRKHGPTGLAEAILLARAGDASAARAKLSTFEVKQMSGTIGALSRTLDALCIEKLTGELRHVDRIALFGETGPDELRKAWPELVAFVERAPAW